MRLAIFLISFATLASCTTAPPDPWVGLETETESAATPLDCGKFPFPYSFDDNSVTYDKQGTNDLNAYRQCSEANEAIAAEHAAQVDQLKLARKGLTEAGQAQRNIATMKQEMLDDERKHNFYTSIGYWIVILGLGLAL